MQIQIRCRMREVLAGTSGFIGACAGIHEVVQEARASRRGNTSEVVRGHRRKGEWARENGLRTWAGEVVVWAGGVGE